MDGLNRLVKNGKVCYIEISNCFAWQLVKANVLAKREGFAKFMSVQGHYNLIFREEERETERIIAGPHEAICSECVKLCMEILDEAGTDKQ